MFTISGALAAGRKSLDWIGVAVIALVTALGGGTVRDVLLDRHPIVWIAHPEFLIVCLAATALTLLYVHLRIPAFRALFVADALGLSFFTIGGVQVAEMSGLSGLLALLMGLITGVVGGVARDMLLAEIPLVLRRGQLYARCRTRRAVARFPTSSNKTFGYLTCRPLGPIEVRTAVEAKTAAAPRRAGPRHSAGWKEAACLFSPSAVQHSRIVTHPHDGAPPRRWPPR